MTCPNCGNEQADGWLSCHKCHIIFSRWKPGQTPPSMTEEDFAPRASSQVIYQPPAAAPEPRRKSTLLKSLALLVFIAITGFALYWVIFPKGAAPLPGAVIDKDKGFAVNLPPEWQRFDPELQRALGERLGLLLPAFGGGAGGETPIQFVKPVLGSFFSPSFNVLVVKGALPAITQKALKELEQVLTAAVPPIIKEFRVESSRIDKVDGLRAIRLTYSGIFTLDTSALAGGGQPGYSQPSAVVAPTRFLQLFVPGRGRGFILTFTAAQDRFGDAEADFRKILDSFRVLKRPARFGTVAQGGIVGGLIGALLYLLRAFLKSLSGSGG